MAAIALVAAEAQAQPMNGGPGGGPMMGGPGGGGPWPVYQRKGFHGGPGFGGPGFNNRYGGGYGFPPTQISGSYFTRPYPYHLDYYKMRYGGSYAPYYGNLYGPSNSFYPAQYNGDHAPNYFFNGQSGPPATYPDNRPASGNGYWAWCWIPGTAESVPPGDSMSGAPVDPAGATTSTSPPTSGNRAAPTLMPPQ